MKNNEVKKEQEPLEHRSLFEKDAELEALLMLLEEQRLKEPLQNFMENSARSKAEDSQPSGLLGYIFDDEEKQVRREERNKEARFMEYLDDLSFILRLQNGAGVRVLRRWLDTSCAFTPLFSEAPQIYATAALADFARERMAEIALADPAGHVRLQLAGARQMAEGIKRTFTES